MIHATFRFYEEINDFLPAARRRRDFGVVCDRLYWEGSHWRNMRARLQPLLDGAY